MWAKEKTPSYNPGNSNDPDSSCTANRAVCHSWATRNPIVPTQSAWLDWWDKSRLITVLPIQLLCGSASPGSLRAESRMMLRQRIRSHTKAMCSPALQPSYRVSKQSTESTDRAPATSRGPGPLQTSLRNGNEGLGKNVCFYKCNLTKSMLLSQCSSQWWLPGGFLWKGWASSELKFAASFFWLQQIKCSLSIHIPVNPQLQWVDKRVRKTNPCHPLTLVSLWTVIARKIDAQRGFFSLKIHRHSEFMEGTLSERHVFAIATELVRHNQITRPAACGSSFHSYPLRHVCLIKPFKCPASHFPHTWAELVPLSLQEHYPKAKLLRIGMFSPMCRSKPLWLKLTWPLPFQAMPSLPSGKDPPGRAFGSLTEMDINFCLSNVLLPQHSNFWICYPQTSYSWGKLFHLK